MQSFFFISASWDDGCILSRTIVRVEIGCIPCFLLLEGLGRNNYQSGDWQLKKVIVNSVVN